MYSKTGSEEEILCLYIPIMMKTSPQIKEWIKKIYHASVPNIQLMLKAIMTMEKEAR